MASNSSVGIPVKAASSASKGITGFDPDKVRRCLNNLQTSYNDLMNQLVDGSQTFTNEMGKCWTCKVAQDFFARIFAPQIEQLITEINSAYASSFETISGAAKKWASTTGSSNAGIISFQQKTKRNIDVSVIRENINGIRGIDSNQATQRVNTLSARRTQIDSALTKGLSAVKNSGFLGGDQEATLINKFNRVKNNISNAFQTILRETKSSVDETISSFGDTAGRISSMFSESVNIGASVGLGN